MGINTAIVTWFNDDRNCGQTLQAFALQTYLRKYKDVQTVILDYRWLARRWVKKNPLTYYLIDQIRMSRHERRRQRVFDRFVANYITKSKPLFSGKVAREYLTSHHVANLLLGSDQIWNPMHGMHDIFFLNIGNEFRKAAYAPSMAEADVLEDNAFVFENNRDALGSIKYLSVRETSSAPFLSNIVGRTVDVVLDPCFLLLASDWSQICKGAPSEEYVLVYCLGDTSFCTELLRDCSVKNILYVLVEDQNDVPTTWNIVDNVGPQEFLTLIRGASLIVTDSFHATVFSIIFEKDFAVAPSTRRWGVEVRKTDLLNRLGLSSRYVKSVDEFINREDINWNDVEAALAKERNHSISYLDRVVDYFNK